MDPARALPWDKVPSYGSLAGDTVYISVVDAEGNVVKRYGSATKPEKIRGDIEKLLPA